MPYIFPDWPGLDFIVVAASCWRAGRWRRRRFYHGRPFNNRPHREVSSLLGIGKSETLFHSDVTKKSTTLIRNYLMTVQQSFFYYYFLLLVENAESQEEHKTFFENLKGGEFQVEEEKTKIWTTLVHLLWVIELQSSSLSSSSRQQQQQRRRSGNIIFGIFHTLRGSPVRGTAFPARALSWQRSENALTLWNEKRDKRR